jgi:hypothetical protein
VTLLQQGVLSEAQLAGALAASLEIPAVDLSRVQIDWSAVHLLRAGFCDTHEVFPFGIEGKGQASERRLLLAMSDPLNEAALDEVEFTTGIRAVPCVATHSQVREAILRYYHRITGTTSAPAPAAILRSESGLISAITEDDGVVVGEEIISHHNHLPAAALTNGARQSGHDLDFLFALKSADGATNEPLERRFWALLRLLQKKGVLTRDEFLAELDEE